MISKERGQYFQEQYNKLEYQFANNELQQKCNQLQSNWNSLRDVLNEAHRLLGNYKHYSTPTEEQNAENEKIVDDVYNLLSGYKYKMNELEGKDNNGK